MPVAKLGWGARPPCPTACPSVPLSPIVLCQGLFLHVCNILLDVTFYLLYCMSFKIYPFLRRHRCLVCMGTRCFLMRIHADIARTFRHYARTYIEPSKSPRHKTLDSNILYIEIQKILLYKGNVIRYTRTLHCLGLQYAGKLHMVISFHIIVGSYQLEHC